MEYNPEGESEFWAKISLSISPKISNELIFHEQISPMLIIKLKVSLIAIGFTHS